jgi:hypothetical protein
MLTTPTNNQNLIFAQMLNSSEIHIFPIPLDEFITGQSSPNIDDSNYDAFTDISGSSVDNDGSGTVDTEFETTTFVDRSNTSDEQVEHVDTTSDDGQTGNEQTGTATSDDGQTGNEQTGTATSDDGQTGNEQTGTATSDEQTGTATSDEQTGTATSDEQTGTATSDEQTGTATIDPLAEEITNNLNEALAGIVGP